MNKKIIELLEEISERCSIIESNSVNYNVQEQIRILTGYRQGVGRNDGSGIVDQALTLSKQQPPAGEFTRVCRIHLDNCGKGNYPQNTRINMAETTLRKACELLDSSEASKADLLEACEGLMEKADNGSADFDDPEPGSIYLKAIVAIAKAKGE